jgi:hypothetical protein
MCSKRGTVAADVPLEGLTVLKGEDKLTLYQFHTKTAKHYFCQMCGIYTHHQRRSNPNECAFNVACLDGVRVDELGDVPVGDGINHPNDQ